MDTLSEISRRQLLGMPFVLALAGKAGNSFAAEKKKIAAIVTVYRYNSHAEVMIPKMVKGYEYYGKHHEPLVEVVSMYTDTVPDIDMSRKDMARFGVPIYPHVSDALTLGGDDLAVDGVVLIGEHGDYPLNEKGQKLYPRYRLYSEIMNVFRKAGRSVPVFSDKHLSVDWDEAKSMYDQSHELNFPFMAGSSLPLWWRKPILELDLQTPVEKAIALYGNGGESSGIHALEILQCMVERRKGGETGIAAVQCLRGNQARKWIESNPWASRLLEYGRIDNQPDPPVSDAKRPEIYVLEYRDGLQAAVFGGIKRSWSFAAEIKGKKEPVYTLFHTTGGRPHGHFCTLVYYIEKMIATGRTVYPVERTLLTTGALAALFDSRYQNGKRLKTPHLNVTYNAQKESVFNRGQFPPLDKEKE